MGQAQRSDGRNVLQGREEGRRAQYPAQRRRKQNGTRNRTGNAYRNSARDGLSVIAGSRASGGAQRSSAGERAGQQGKNSDGLENLELWEISRESDDSRMMRKMLLGLVKKDSGSVTLFNQVMADYQSGIYARIGSTIESPGFYSNLTAVENLSVFSRLRGKVDRNKIRKALGVVGLPYQDKKIFSKYSLGMKQRLAIANAIVNDPELLIFDEPTNGLDPIGIAEMRTLIRRLTQQRGADRRTGTQIEQPSVFY